MKFEAASLIEGMLNFFKSHKILLCEQPSTVMLLLILNVARTLVQPRNIYGTNSDVNTAPPKLGNTAVIFKTLRVSLAIQIVCLSTSSSGVVSSIL
jgi:hypothetical protein